MSAYVVSDKQINDMLNFIHYHANSVSEAMTMRFCNSLQNDMLDSERLTLLGRRLINYNYKSVNARYEDRSREYFGDNTSVFFDFKPYHECVSIAQFLKYCDNLDYQCCEPKDYYIDKTSVFWDILQLKQFGYRKIDGYSQSKWGI